MWTTCLLALALTAGQAATPSVATRPAEVDALRLGEHFALEAHGLSRSIAERALVVLERVVPFAEAVHGPVVIERRGAVVRGERLRVQLFASPAALAVAWDALKQEPPPDPDAFTDPDTNVAWIALRPTVSSEFIDTLGLPRPTIHALAREGARLYARRSRGAAAALPFVYEEGASQLVAHRTCGALLPLEDRLEDPASSRLALRAQELIPSGGVPDVFAFLGGSPAGLTHEERRALAAEFFEFLAIAENRAVFQTLCYAARVTKQEDTQAALATSLRLAVGDDAARASFQASFERWLGSRAPRWEELHGDLWPLGDTLLQSAGLSNALCWRRSAPFEAGYEMSGEVALFPGEHRQANLLLGRSATGFVQVSFVADHGVDVLRFVADPNGGAWSALGSAEVAALSEGRWTTFRVLADGARLEVWIDDKPLLNLQDAALPAPCVFGLGAYSGSTCAWRKLAFKALP